MNKKSAKSSATKKNGNSPIVKGYLIAYNAIETLGWSYLFYQLISWYTNNNSPKDLSLYETIKWSLIIFQNAAILEIFHAASGIVPSNPILTTFQVLSRVIVVCGVLMATHAARESIGLTLCLICWCVTEIIRYATYTFNLLGMVPYFLKWMRYSFFVFLYPLGITGELLCLYAAQKEVGDKKLFTMQMPNAYNMIFNYQYVLIFIMTLYIPIFPKLYGHMFIQRKKSLGRQQQETLKKSK